MMTRSQFEEYCGRKKINHPEDIEEQWFAYQLEQQDKPRVCPVCEDAACEIKSSECGTDPCRVGME